MSIHRSLCIPLPLGRLSQRISRISTHSSGALYQGSSPTTMGPTISSGTHRYAVASPSEVGWVAAGAVPARSPRPRVLPGRAKEPWALGGQRAGNEGGHDRSLGRWAATKATSAPIIAASRACRLAVSYGPPYCPVALARVTTRHTRRRFVSSRSHPAPSVVVATKVPNPGQRLPNSRPILPTGFLPLALVSRHIRPSMTTRRLTASPIIRGSILRNSSHSVNTRSASALSHATLAESA